MSPEKIIAIKSGTIIGLQTVTLLGLLGVALMVGQQKERMENYLSEVVTVGDHREWQRATAGQSPGWLPADMDAIHERRHGRWETFR